MDFFEYIVNFYASLNMMELLLFWFAIIVFVILIFWCINSSLKIKELRRIIATMNEEKKINIIKTSDVDFNKIKLVKVDNRTSSINQNDNILESEIVENNGIYQKNVLNEFGSKNQTSPVSIGKVNDIVNLGETQKLTPIDMDLNRLTSEKLTKEDIESLKEILNKDIIDEEDDTPIEFTSFENTQEEDAVISYDELIKNTKMASSRQERFNVEVEDDTEFLKELKSFRKNM